MPTAVPASSPTLSIKPTLQRTFSASSLPVAEKGHELDEEDETQLKELQRKKGSKKKKQPIVLNLAGTKYEVVRTIAEQFGVVTTKDDENSYLYWSDSFISSEKICELKPFQKVNHFAGMGEICRKDCLARNMAKMIRSHPEEYNFVPKTWIFPSEYNIFQSYVSELKRKKKHKTFIVKPNNGAMGNGINVYRNGEKIPPMENTIVQEYLDKPLLLEGYKFDLRVYVLLTSCDPLRMFLYDDGLVRLSTEKYCSPTESNVEQLFMHLTNYSVNKKNENFERHESVDQGSKRSIKYLNEFLRKNDYDVLTMWKNITDVIIKTLIVAEPHVLHAYRMCRPGQTPGTDSVCFEILGFDIMLDRKLKPWLLEINRSPSFGTDEKIDFDIKSGLIEDTFRLLNMKSSDRKKGIAAQKAESQRRLLKPTRRTENEMTDLDRKRALMEKRRQELKERLMQVRRENAREDFENRNMGQLRRIFPPADKISIDKYTDLITNAFHLFLSGRAVALQKEMSSGIRQLKEDEILDMLAQCELEDEVPRDGRPRLPKPLVSMPIAADAASTYDDDLKEATSKSYRVSSPSSLHQKNTTHFQSPSRMSRPPTRPNSGKNSRSRPLSAQRPGSRPQSGRQEQRSRSLTRPISSLKSSSAVVNCTEDMLANSAAKDEITRRTLAALTEMKIKFPGKNDDEAECILEQLQDNWKFHKPRIASYWLVKLDSIKRRKVIDIVRSNVRVVLQRTWQTSDIDNLKLHRIFNRVFNRLLWSHGQGLWNCFTGSGNSWETICSKSTEFISSSEMECCRRIVQLCRDCLLIVYQFASDAKSSSSAAVLSNTTKMEHQQPQLTPTRASLTSRESNSKVLNNYIKTTWSPSVVGQTMSPVSQRMARLYRRASHI